MNLGEELGRELGFENVTSQAGLSVTPSRTIDAEWGDADGANGIDLFVANFYDSPQPWFSEYYVNQGDGTFSAEYTSAFDVAPNAVNDVEWIDFDNDEDLDLAISSYTGDTYVLTNHPAGVFDSYDPVDLGGGIESAGLSWLDQDLDRRWDVIVHDRFVGPIVFENRQYYNGLKFYDQTEVVGLSGGGSADCAAVEDIDGDGDPDIFFGRDLGGEKFYYVAETNPAGSGKSNSPENHWVGIELIGTGANNEASIGAQVVVSANGVSAVRQITAQSGAWVGGGSRLVFGLGEYDGDVDVVIQWPNGIMQEEVISSAMIDQHHQFYDETDPGVINTSVCCSKEYVPPDGDIEWTFTWKTSYLSRGGLDKVEISGPGFGGPSTYYGEPGSIVKNADGTFSHTVSFIRPCVISSSNPYNVSSSTDLVTSTSTTRYTKVKFCFSN